MDATRHAAQVRRARNCAGAGTEAERVAQPARIFSFAAAISFALRKLGAVAGRARLVMSAERLAGGLPRPPSDVSGAPLARVG